MNTTHSMDPWLLDMHHMIYTGYSLVMLTCKSVIKKKLYLILYKSDGFVLHHICFSQIWTHDILIILLIYVYILGSGCGRGRWT
jgi:hypothetical protein